MLVPLLPTKKLDPAAKLPVYGSEFAAGMDLHARTDKPITISMGERKLIKTGIAVAIPVGYYGRIAPRSGLAHKNGIDVMAGVIDQDYRGEIGVILINLGSAPFIVNDGDRIAQMVLECADQALIREFEILPETDRGDGGFGSTGV